MIGCFSGMIKSTMILFRGPNQLFSFIVNFSARDCRGHISSSLKDGNGGSTLDNNGISLPRPVTHGKNQIAYISILLYVIFIRASPLQIAFALRRRKISKHPRLRTSRSSHICDSIKRMWVGRRSIDTEREDQKEQQVTLFRAGLLRSRSPGTHA